MRLSDFQKNQEKDKVEITKQQQAEIQKIFENRVKPHRNHVLFEINCKTKTIELAQYKAPNTTIHWKEALERYHKHVIYKIDIFKAKTVTKSEVIKNENCIYILALNRENCIKILKRDFGIII